jgi:hypothetical protein
MGMEWSRRRDRARRKRVRCVNARVGRVECVGLHHLSCLEQMVRAKVVWGLGRNLNTNARGPGKPQSRQTDGQSYSKQLSTNSSPLFPRFYEGAHWRCSLPPTG